MPEALQPFPTGRLCLITGSSSAEEGGGFGGWSGDRRSDCRPGVCPETEKDCQKGRRVPAYFQSTKPGPGVLLPTEFRLFESPKHQTPGRGRTARAFVDLKPASHALGQDHRGRADLIDLPRFWKAEAQRLLEKTAARQGGTQWFGRPGLGSFMQSAPSTAGLTTWGCDISSRSTAVEAGRSGEHGFHDRPGHSGRRVPGLPSS